MISSLISVGNRTLLFLSISEAKRVGICISLQQGSPCPGFPRRGRCPTPYLPQPDPIQKSTQSPKTHQRVLEIKTVRLLFWEGCLPWSDLKNKK